MQPVASCGTMPVQNKAGQQHGTLVGACSAASFYSCSVVCLMERKMTLEKAGVPLEANAGESNILCLWYS